MTDFDDCQGLGGAGEGARHRAAGGAGDRTKRWIVNEFDADYGDYAAVEAADEQEAARRGAEVLYELAQDRAQPGEGMPDPPPHVFVAPWTGRVAFSVEFEACAERAELQCCAGGPHALYVNGSGHYGGCPEGPRHPSLDGVNAGPATPETPVGASRPHHREKGKGT